MEHAYFVLVNTAAGRRLPCHRGGNTGTCATYYAAGVPLFHAVLLSLRHEIHLPLNRFAVAGARRHRHIPALAAHHALPAAIGGDVLPQLAARLPVATRAQAPGPVHTQLPRGTQHTAARKDYFVVAVVAHLAALHGADIRLVVAARRHAGRGCGRKLVHPVA